LKLAFYINSIIDRILIFNDQAQSHGLITSEKFEDFIEIYAKRNSKNLNSRKIYVNLLMLSGLKSENYRENARQIVSTISSKTYATGNYYN